MGSKNLRSSGSSASGLKGGLRAWLHKKKGADISTEGSTEKKVHLFSRKKEYSVSRSPDFNWEITRYDREPRCEDARAEFEKRRNIEIEIPKVEAHVMTEPEMAQVPVKNSTRPTVPTLDVYFKEESIKAETKIAKRSEVKTEIRSFRQESLFESRPRMVEAKEDLTTIAGASYFSGVSADEEVPTCSSAAEVPVQRFILDSFEDTKATEDMAASSEPVTVKEGLVIPDASEDDQFIESVCDEIATFTVMNDILPEIMAEEFIQEEIPEADPEDVFMEELCEDIVAKFIVDELMPELLREKTVPDYIISEISGPQVMETTIEIPETVEEPEHKAMPSDVTSFLFGFGNNAVQKKGSVGFRFVFGKDEEADFDDEEAASISVSEAAITASSLSGSPIRL